MKDNYYAISDGDGYLMGVAQADEVSVLKDKIVSMLDGVRPPVHNINLDGLESVNDFESHDLNIVFDDEGEIDDENYQIQRIEIY